MKSIKPLALLSSIALAITLLSGCTSTAKYAPSGQWTAATETLGPVKADSGAWPLSLKTPPPEYTYYSALRSAAKGTYGVPENEVVLGEVEVKYSSEIDGTIRSWTATATAGRDRNAPPMPPAAPSKK